MAGVLGDPQAGIGPRPGQILMPGHLAADTEGEAPPQRRRSARIKLRS
jgi:hypothetical protein